VSIYSIFSARSPARHNVEKIEIYKYMLISTMDTNTMDNESKPTTTEIDAPADLSRTTVISRSTRSDSDSEMGEIYVPSQEDQYVAEDQITLRIPINDDASNEPQLVDECKIIDNAAPAESHDTPTTQGAAGTRPSVLSTCAWLLSPITWAFKYALGRS
jgi:hypothetical protein